MNYLRPLKHFNVSSMYAFEWRGNFSQSNNGAVVSFVIRANPY
jgi:hypothetical protein